MAQRSTKSTGRVRTPKGGRVTKTTEGTASVAPEGNESTEPATIEQPVEVAETTELSEEDELNEIDPAELAAAIAVEDAREAELAAAGESSETPAESPAPVVVDPFADLAEVTVGDFTFRDFSEAETSDPRKYESVQRAALESKAHMKPGWKHSAAMIALGTNKRELKPTSVYGTISAIVQEYGRTGVPAYVLVAKLRQRQIGNKRSHYCTKLPPIGWAEGWIDTFLSRGMGKVTGKPAPSLTPEVATELAEGDAEANIKAEELRNAA